VVEEKGARNSVNSSIYKPVLHRGLLSAPEKVKIVPWYDARCAERFQQLIAVLLEAEAQTLALAGMQVTENKRKSCES
jgi:hypothetical protein